MTPGPAGEDPTAISDPNPDGTASDTSTAVIIPSAAIVQVTPTAGDATTVENTSTNPSAEDPTAYSNPDTDASGDPSPNSSTSTAIIVPKATIVQVTPVTADATLVENLGTDPVTAYTYPVGNVGLISPNDITSTVVSIPTATVVQMTPGIGSQTTVENQGIVSPNETPATAYTFPSVDSFGIVSPNEVSSVAVAIPKAGVLQMTPTLGSNRTELANLSVPVQNLRAYSAPSVNVSGHVVPSANSVFGSIPKNTTLRWSLNSPSTFDMIAYADAAKPALSAAKVMLGADNKITGSLGSVWVVAQSDPSSKYVIDTTATSTTISNQASVATNSLALYLCSTCFVDTDGTFNNPGNVTPLMVAPGDTVVAGDTDGDLVLDGDDACPTTPGRADYQGCPVADMNKVVFHTIDKTTTKSYCAGKGSCKAPIEGAQVKVFDRNKLVGKSLSCNDATVTLEKNPKGTLYPCIFEDVALASAQAASFGCTTDSLGQCTAGEETMGDYLVIVKAIDSVSGKTMYTGSPKGPSDFVNGLATKDFQFICMRNATGSTSCQGGSKTTVTGSLLEIVYPLYTVWDETSEYYPFIFTSDSDWTVDLCLSVPEGYKIADQSSCIQTLVAGEVATVFTVVETGSPEPNAKIKLRASHIKQAKGGKEIKGEKVTKDIEIDIPGERTKAMKEKSKGKGRASLYLGMAMAALACMSVILITTRRRRK